MTKRELITLLKAILEALAKEETPPPRPKARLPEPFTVTEDAFERRFVPYGEIRRVTLPTSWITRR